MKDQIRKCKRWMLALLLVSMSASTVQSQSLKLAWQQDFDKPVQWYVRTSPGILLVKTDKTLTALDGTDGRQLWGITELEWPKWYTGGGVEPGIERGKNLIELPGLGIVVLNRVKFANEKHDVSLSMGRVFGVKGKVLWGASIEAK